MHVAGVGEHYVLALLPSTQGMAYVLFEGPLSLVDWGTTSIKGKTKNLKCADMAKNLMERYVPDVIVLEDSSRISHPKSVRVRMLNQSFQTIAGAHGVDVMRISSKDIRKKFEATGARTKQERAKIIASLLPALSHRLPPKRKPWMAEDPRMALFEAAALGLAYYGLEHAPNQ